MAQLCAAHAVLCFALTAGQRSSSTAGAGEGAGLLHLEHLRQLGVGRRHGLETLLNLCCCSTACVQRGTVSCRHEQPLRLDLRGLSNIAKVPKGVGRLDLALVPTVGAEAALIVVTPQSC